VTDALLVSEDDVRRIMAEPGATRSAIAAMEHALAEHGRGAFASPARVVVGGGGEQHGRSLRVLPCIAPSAGGAACRIYTTNKSAGADAPAPCELILLFDGETMELRAAIEDYSLHSLRTAAPSAVAVDRLARPDVRTLAVIGSGRQARGQLAAVASVRSFEEVRVYSRDPLRRAAFADEMTGVTGVEVEPVASAEDAVRGADVVVVATNTATPVVRRAWLAPGTLVVSIAPCELHEDVVLDARLVPCAAEEVLHGMPRWEPVRSLVENGRLTPESLEPNLGEVVAGTRELDRGASDVTVVLSTGMAFWDVAIAGWADARARALGLGSPLWHTGGSRTGVGYRAPQVDHA
jgi:alanine dehydrogenase